MYVVWIDVDIDDAYDHVNSTRYTSILWVVYIVPMSKVCVDVAVEESEGEDVLDRSGWRRRHDNGNVWMDNVVEHV